MGCAKPVEEEFLNDDGQYEVKISGCNQLVYLKDLEGRRVSKGLLRGDFGVIYGDAEGTTNIFRNYWSNQATGLVNDVPGEIMLTPVLWGGITLEAKP